MHRGREWTLEVGESSRQTPIAMNNTIETLSDMRLLATDAPSARLSSPLLLAIIHFTSV